MHKTNNNDTRAGFTIVELLIVIVVIGILAAITIVSFNGVQDKAKFAQKRADIIALQKIVEMHKAETGSYPSTAGAWRFQRQVGNNFMPGVVPNYASSLPSITDGPTPVSNTNNTYAYRSNGTEYKLIRFNAFADGGISDGEYAQVPTSMRDTATTVQDRWGVWSSGGGVF